MLIFWNKFENNELPKSVSTLFTRRSEIHSYNTRQSNTFNLPRINVETVKHAFPYNAIKTYNKFEHIFNFQMKSSLFKKNVKEYLNIQEL